MRKVSLEPYQEGLGFSAISSVVEISYGTVYQWVKQWGSQVLLPQNNDPVAIMELDEMHSYVGSKNYC